jgi:hypothetical protein
MTDEPDTEVIVASIIELVNDMMKEAKSPILCAAVGCNGSLYYGRFSPDKFEPLAEHFVDGGFTLPLNIMLVDSTGKDARRAVIEAGRRPRFLN